MSSRSSTRTIRLEDGLDKEIARLAEEDGTSVNFIVNRALQEFSEWDIVSRKFGFGEFSLAFVNKLMQKLDDKECEDLGNWSAREVFKPFAEFQFGNLTFESFLEVFRRFAKYSGRFKFDDAKKGTQHMIFLKHDSGRKWSLYYCGLVKSIFEDMLGGHVKLEYTEDLMVVKIDKFVE